MDDDPWIIFHDNFRTTATHKNKRSTKNYNDEIYMF